MSLFGLAISMASKNPTTADSGDVGQSENEVDSIQFSTQNDNLNGGNAGVKRSDFAGTPFSDKPMFEIV